MVDHRGQILAQLIEFHLSRQVLLHPGDDIMLIEVNAAGAHRDRYIIAFRRPGGAAEADFMPHLQRLEAVGANRACPHAVNCADGPGDFEFQ